MTDSYRIRIRNLEEQVDFLRETLKDLMDHDGRVYKAKMIVKGLDDIRGKDIDVIPDWNYEDKLSD